MRLDILFENTHFIVINKPAGLLSIPDRIQSAASLKDHLIEQYGSIYTVHRLDRETSGVIVFAKNEQTHKHLSAQFEERSTKKIYNGLVCGQVTTPAGTVEEPIAPHYKDDGTMMIHAKGKTAITDFKILQSFKSFTWMQFHILTGRTHQIRLHSKHLGHPIACDTVYGDGKPILLSAIKHRFKLSKLEEEERPLLNRLALHAQLLSFKDSSGNQYEFEAPLPKDLKALLQQLEKWNKK